MDNRKQVEEQNERNAKLVKEKDAVFRRLFASDDGQKVLNNLKAYCGQERTSVPKDYNPHQIFCAEGMRSVYLYILAKTRKEKNE